MKAYTTLETIRLFDLTSLMLLGGRRKTMTPIFAIINEIDIDRVQTENQAIYISCNSYSNSYAVLSDFD